MKRVPQSLEQWNERGVGKFPGHVGIDFTEVGAALVVGQFTVQPLHLAPNGYLHAGSIVTLADTCCGYGCVANLPEGASGFTTIELKSNHLGTSREGTIESRASPLHLGKSTQVWDATVVHKETGRMLAMFRCTQLVLYGK